MPYRVRYMVLMATLDPQRQHSFMSEAIWHERHRGKKVPQRPELQRKHTEELVKVSMVSTKLHYFQTDAHSGNGLNGPSEKTMWSSDSLGLASGKLGKICMSLHQVRFNWKSFCLVNLCMSKLSFFLALVHKFWPCLHRKFVLSGCLRSFLKTMGECLGSEKAEWRNLWGQNGKKK